MGMGTLTSTLKRHNFKTVRLLERFRKDWHVERLEQLMPSTPTAVEGGGGGGGGGERRRIKN